MQPRTAGSVGVGACVRVVAVCVVVVVRTSSSGMLRELGHAYARVVMETSKVKQSHAP